MKKFLLLAAILIAVPIFAQSGPIKVSVVAGNSQSVSQEIADMLSGRIGASSRYALASNRDILLSVNCLPDVVDAQQVGVTCDTSILYWPVWGVALHAELEGTMSTGSRQSQVTEDLFDSFIQNTSDEKLRASAAGFKRYLNQAIILYSKGVN